MPIPRSDSRPYLALVLTGIGWGTAGPFVRLLSATGASVFDLLAVRLAFAGVLIFPYLLWQWNRGELRYDREVWFRAGLIGAGMFFYYAGAIAALHRLPLAEAVLLIGSSPLIAWLTPMVADLRKPTREEWSRGIGVGIAIAGLGIFILWRGEVNEALRYPSRTGLEYWLGVSGGIWASMMTVFNARALKTWGPSHAPSPMLITAACIVLGLLLLPIFGSGSKLLLIFIKMNPLGWIGFGWIATVIPGLAIAYAGSRLRPEATATASLQLQIWTMIFGWIFFGEALSGVQIAAAAMVLIGTAGCLFGWRFARRTEGHRAIT